MYAVRLTPKGQSALNSVKPVAARVDQRILAPLKADQRHDFVEALGQIVRTMNRSALQR
jgi:DNA-binding MarR family transcriptional regulator